MDGRLARELVEKCLPRFKLAGLPDIQAKSIKDVKEDRGARQSLWGGCGAIYKFCIETAEGPDLSIVVKKVAMPSEELSRGDQRKKDSYEVEAAFYSAGHAERLIDASCIVPFPLYVETAPSVTICMTELKDSRVARSREAFLVWLARLHGTYWGCRADEACTEGGLQKQGCYWHLDTRPDEHRKLLGRSEELHRRLGLAARAIDEWLKNDPLQSVCHGDAKGANIMYSQGTGGAPVALVYDFQYCGKASAAKDLAYFFNVEVHTSTAQQEAPLLQTYLRELSGLLEARGERPPSLEELQTSLEIALCDWRRFSLIGLGGWGNSSVDRSRVREVLDKLDGGRPLASEEGYSEAIRVHFPLRTGQRVAE